MTRSTAVPATTRALSAAADIAAPAAWTLSASGIGERSGAPASGSAGRTGHQRAAARRRRHLGRLEGDGAVAADPVGGPEALVEMLHRRLRVERDHRVLELVGSELGDDVGRDQDERVADRDLAAPDLRLQPVRGQAALAMGIGQRREPGLADEVGLGRPDRRHVHLVATDDGDADADRPVVVGRRAARAGRPGGSAACSRSRSPSGGRRGCRPTRRSSTRCGSSRRPAASPRARGAS